LQPRARGGVRHGQALCEQEKADGRTTQDAVGGGQPQSIGARRQGRQWQQWTVGWATAPTHDGERRTQADGRTRAMMTIVTRVTLKEGSEPKWDAAMKARMESARSQPGWVGGQLTIPLDGPNARVIIGTWQTRADWEAWHADPKFQETREEMRGLETRSSEEWWHEVVTDLRAA
jgi:heme-degrading monooxygenase HmoA